MGKNFEVTPASRRAIDKAMARLDAKRQRARKAATAKRLGLKARREQERAAARRAAVKPDVPNRRPNELRKRYALPGWQVLVARMEPGTWYTWADIRALMPEFERGSVKGWLYLKATRAGMIERAGSPDFRPDINNPAEQGGRYLYSIAPAMAGEAAQWRLALGIGADTSETKRAP